MKIPRRCSGGGFFSGAQLRYMGAQRAVIAVEQLDSQNGVLARLAEYSADDVRAVEPASDGEVFGVAYCLYGAGDAMP